MIYLDENTTQISIPKTKSTLYSNFLLTFTNSLTKKSTTYQVVNVSDSLVYYTFNVSISLPDAGEYEYTLFPDEIGMDYCESGLAVWGNYERTTVQHDKINEKKQYTR